jgi:hypothetical protein
MGSKIQLSDNDIKALIVASGRKLEAIGHDNPRSKTDVPGITRLSLEQRDETRKYLESLQPEKVKALKGKSPEEYRAILKSKDYVTRIDVGEVQDGRRFYDHGLSSLTAMESERLDSTSEGSSGSFSASSPARPLPSPAK